MDVLLIGDSLIAYHDWQRALPAHRATVLGVPGETVQELRLRLLYVRRCVARADAVVAMIGTNNLAAGDLVFVTDWEELIDSLAAGYPDAVLIFTSLLPVRLPWLDGGAVGRLNRLLAEAAQRRGALFHDLHPEFLGADGATDGSLFLGDGVHLSSQGYRVWTESLSRLLAALPRR